MNHNRLFFLFLLTAAMLAGCDQPNAGTKRDASSPASNAPPPLAGAQIGGPFALTDQQGRPVKSSDFDGKYRLIYFGYTSCPDVCPVDIARLMQGLKLFEQAQPQRAAHIQPIFISLDPARDTPERLRSFAANFHPRLLALSGDEAATQQAAKAYLVTYRKQPGNAPDQYLIAHTQLAYLMGPKGEPIALLPIDDPSTEQVEGEAAAVAAELAKWTK